MNYEIARWIKSGDLCIQNQSISKGFGELTLPFCCLIANSDGVVNYETAISAYDIIGSTKKEIIRVGNEKLKFAHADLFISKYNGDSGLQFCF